MRQGKLDIFSCFHYVHSEDIDINLLCYDVLRKGFTEFGLTDGVCRY